MSYCIKIIIVFAKKEREISMELSFNLKLIMYIGFLKEACDYWLYDVWYLHIPVFTLFMHTINASMFVNFDCKITINKSSIITLFFIYIFIYVPYAWIQWFKIKEVDGERLSCKLCCNHLDNISQLKRDKTLL